MLTSENEGEEIKKVWFMEKVKKPMEAGMLHTIDGETLHSFTKNTWINDSGASCHITNENTGLYNVVNKLVQGSSGNTSATKRGKFCINVCQVDGT